MIKGWVINYRKSKNMESEQQMSRILKKYLKIMIFVLYLSFSYVIIKKIAIE